MVYNYRKMNFTSNPLSDMLKLVMRKEKEESQCRANSIQNLNASSMNSTSQRKLQMIRALKEGRLPKPTFESLIHDEHCSLHTCSEKRSPFEVNNSNDSNDDIASLLSMDSVDHLSSMSSIEKIKELERKLTIQENTKLQLFKQCQDLENQLENQNFSNVNKRAEEYKIENIRLREINAKLELESMNMMDAANKNMAIMDIKFNEKLLWREQNIHKLEQELRSLKTTTLFGYVYASETFSIQTRSSGESFGSKFGSLPGDIEWKRNIKAHVPTEIILNRVSNI